MNLKERFILLLLLVCTIAYPNGDNNKVATYYIPKPDVMPQPSLAEKIVRFIPEPQLYHQRKGNVPSSRYGIDVSRYQGEINWKEVAKDARVTYVYLKATESTGLVDRTYTKNLKEARKVGLPVGVYHFFSPNTPSHQQLANFTNTVDPRTQDLIPIVDVEIAPKRKSQVLPFLRRLRAFVDGVEKYFGCKPMIYTSQDFYNRYLAGKFLDCPFMFARYAEDVPQVTDNVRFMVWQFTASGRIRGIKGDVDRSCLMNHYTVDDIRYNHKSKKKKK